jgi:multidrug efflux pump subunit AcrA (membrane-fusion protein)
MSGPRHRWRARFPLPSVSVAIFLMLGGIGVWSVGTEIAGAVVAPGIVEVQSERQVIQHPDGGVVGEILARDGDSVAAGDVLLRLDGTFLRSELAIVESQLAEIFARNARLMAERDGADTPDFSDPPDLETVIRKPFRTRRRPTQSFRRAPRLPLAGACQLDEQQARSNARSTGWRPSLLPWGDSGTDRRRGDRRPVALSTGVSCRDRGSPNCNARKRVWRARSAT